MASWPEKGSRAVAALAPLNRHRRAQTERRHLLLDDKEVVL